MFVNIKNHGVYFLKGILILILIINNKVKEQMTIELRILQCYLMTNSNTLPFYYV